MRKLLLLTITAFFLFSFITTNGQNPTVTINQSAAQPDPANLTPIYFTVVFDQPVIGFATGDVVISGTAGGIVALVTGGPTLFNAAVTGMTSCGTVIVNIPAGVCTNTLTQPNLASTSIDNTVTYGGLPAIVNVTPFTSCGGVTGSGPCNPLTASGNADTYVWSPLAGLYTDCAHTIPYTGTNTTTVYAAPTVHTVYTVTGTIIASGCINFTTATVKYTPPAPVITPSSVNMCLGDPPVKLKVVAGVPAGPAVWSPASGLFWDAAATIPYVAGTPTDSVWTRPSPAGVYTYQVTVPGIPGPPIWVRNPAAISIPVGGAASLYSSDVSLYVLPVTGARVRSVVLHGVSHTRSSDIDVLLQSPSGQSVILMSDVGGSNAINATYTFADWSAPMSLTAANPTGTYSPVNSGSPDNFPPPGPGSVNISSGLNAFTGNFNGTWRLFVVDDDGTSDQGVISGGYTINFDTAAYCYSPPRSVTVTVSMPVTITSQPANVTLCPANTTAVFMVSIAGGPVSFQWQVSTNGGTTWNNAVGPPYSGSNTATMTVNPVTAGMNGYLYRVIMNSGAGCSGATSNAALLSINPIPTVTITANPLIIGPTQTTTILSTVTPNPAATYTWYYNNSVLPGAVSSSLLVIYGSPGDYQLRVTDANNCGIGVSNIVTIANSFALNMYTYPNPSGGIFQVRYSSEAGNTLQRSLTVYNNWGEKIITRNFTQTIPYQKIEVDVRAHGKGLYWVEMRDANGKRLGMNRVVVQ